MNLSEQALEARRAYKRAWAKKNPEKVKAQQARYWQRRAEQAQRQAQQAPPARLEAVTE